MGVPKRRTSKSRIRSRKAAHRVSPRKATEGPDGGPAALSHRVNPVTGQYKGRQVLTISED